MKKLLPMADPIITTIPSHSNFLSIALLNDSGVEWLCNYYINIYVRYTKNPESNWIDSCKANFLDWGTVDRNYSNVVKSYFVPRPVIPGGIIDFIELSIKNGYYLITRVDQYYLPCCKSYLKNHNPHCALINGIDSEEHKIYISDFFSNGNYQTIEVDFNHFEEAFEGVSEEIIPNVPDYQFFRTEVQLLKPMNHHYKFSIGHLLKLLEDYIGGTDSTGRFFHSSYIFEAYQSQEESIYLYGIDCIPVIAELFCEGRMGIQNIHMLFDRYHAMVFRLEFLQKKYPFLDLEEERKQYQAMEHTSLLLRNMCLKYKMNRKQSLKENILSGFHGLQETERTAIGTLIQKLASILPSGDIAHVI